MAKWLRPYLIETTGSLHTITWYEDGELKQTQKHTKGDHRGKGLKVLCANCNNTWGSRIQSDVQRYLTPLLAFKVTDISSAGAEAIARWAFMLAAVWEAADPARAALSYADRAEFSRTRLVPVTTLIFIRPFVGTRSLGTVRHRALLNHDNRPLGIAHRPNVASTLFTVGAVCFHVVMSRNNASFAPDLKSQIIKSSLLTGWKRISRRGLSAREFTKSRPIDDHQFAAFHNDFVEWMN